MKVADLCEEQALELQVRVPTHELGQGRHDHVAADRHVHADAQRPGQTAVAFGSDAFQLGELAQDLPAAAHDLLAVLGQAQLARRPVEERDPELLLELSDGVAHRGGVDVHQPGRAREAAGIGRADQQLDATHTIHDSSDS